MIIGSSFTDPPLLQALMTPTEHERLAVFPLQSDEWSHESARELQAKLDFTALRLSQFEVLPLFVDYFQQVGQLMNEVCIATPFAGTAQSYAESDYRYGARLSDWWQTWRGSSSDQDFIGRFQQGDHVALLSSLSSVSEIFRGSYSSSTSRSRQMVVESGDVVYDDHHINLVG